MANLKQRILEKNSDIASQEALVKKLLPAGPRIIKNVIPAGKTMFEQIGKNNMEDAVYNWLRGCGAFTEVTISFAREPSRWVTTQPVKAVSFDTRDPKPQWERTSHGRRDLAKDIAELMKDSSKRIVYLQVKHDGIYLGEDRTSAFKPRIVVTADNLEQHPGHSVGDQVATPDWEPYVEFTSRNRSAYTSIAGPRV